MAWRAAGAILALHAQLKWQAPRAAPPGTAAATWGTIADAAHTSTSDHAAKDFPGWGNDIVTAGDFPDRPDLGLDARAVLDSIRRSRDPRVKYGISHGQMFSSYAAGGVPAWTWRTYTGTDGHFTHGHLSVVGDPRADDQRSWTTGLGQIMTQPHPPYMADDNAAAQAWRVHSIIHGEEVVPQGPQAGEEVWLVKELKRHAVMLTSLAAQIGAVTAPNAGAPFTAEQLAQLRALIEETEDS